MTKLKELRDKHGASFADTVKAMKVSFYEQTVLMLLSTCLLMIEGTRELDRFQHNARFIVETLLCACFIYSLQILHDTAKSIFIILNFEDENGQK